MDRLMIQDIVARWPGSLHYSTIFFIPSIFRCLEEKKFGNGLILGNGGYAVNTHLLLSLLLKPVTRNEHLYQESQIRMRNVERSYDVWKSFLVI